MANDCNLSTHSSFQNVAFFPIYTGTGTFSNLYTLEPIFLLFHFQEGQTLFSCRWTAKTHTKFCISPKNIHLQSCQQELIFLPSCGSFGHLWKTMFTLGCETKQPDWDLVEQLILEPILELEINSRMVCLMRKCNLACICPKSLKHCVLFGLNKFS